MNKCALRSMVTIFASSFFTIFSLHGMIIKKKNDLSLLDGKTKYWQKKIERERKAYEFISQCIPKQDEPPLCSCRIRNPKEARERAGRAFEYLFKQALPDVKKALERSNIKERNKLLDELLGKLSLVDEFLKGAESLQKINDCKEKAFKLLNGYIETEHMRQVDTSFLPVINLLDELIKKLSPFDESLKSTESLQKINDCKTKEALKLLHGYKETKNMRRLVDKDFLLAMHLVVYIKNMEFLVY